MSDSYIGLDSEGRTSTFAGPDAVSLHRAITLRACIELHRMTGMIPTRGVTITRMLTQATGYTRKSYSGRGRHERAIADLGVWIEAMRAALPVVQSGAPPLQSAPAAPPAAPPLP